MHSGKKLHVGITRWLQDKCKGESDKLTLVRSSVILKSLLNPSHCIYLGI